MARVIKIEEVKKEIDSVAKVAAKTRAPDGHNLLSSILHDVKQLKQKLDYLEEKIGYAEQRAKKRNQGGSKQAKKAPEESTAVEEGQSA